MHALPGRATVSADNPVPPSEHLGPRIFVDSIEFSRAGHPGTLQKAACLLGLCLLSDYPTHRHKHSQRAGNGRKQRQTTKATFYKYLQFDHS